MSAKKQTVSLAEVRSLVAAYMHTEGCDCCRSLDHPANKEALAKLLKVKPYSDGSGYNFAPYRPTPQVSPTKK